MKKSEFIEGLKDILEIQDSIVTEGDALKSLENYDSISVLSIIAFVDENFDKRLKAADLLRITTVGDLMQLVGEENFTG